MVYPVRSHRCAGNSDSMEKMYSDENRPAADELEKMKAKLSAALDEIVNE